MGGSFYTAWLWLHEGNPYELVLTATLAGGGAVHLFVAWLWKADEEKSADIRRPRHPDLAKGLESVGWGSARKR